MTLYCYIKDPRANDQMTVLQETCHLIQVSPKWSHEILSVGKIKGQSWTASCSKATWN